MSELIKTLNLTLVLTHKKISKVTCESFAINTKVLPCYLPSTFNQATRDCELCVLNSNIEAKPTVEILSKFHE